MARSPYIRLQTKLPIPQVICQTSPPRSRPAAFFLAYIVITNACAVSSPEALFVQTTVPDGSYAEYLQGHLCVLQSGLHLRYLVVAHDWLNGVKLTAA